MNNNEVKPSYSLKYLFLTALTAAIIGGIGLGITKLYESQPTKEISVANGYVINLINDSSLPEDKFEVEYFYKGKKRTKISSLFRKKVIIKNSGNVGVIDLSVTAILRDDDIQLLDQPKIKTIPIEVIDTISVIKAKESTRKKHSWIISLLNPGESVTFEYSAFSEKKLDSISLDIIPRKKDWKVNYEELGFSVSARLSDNIIFWTFLMIFILLVPYLLAYPFYRFQWSRRPDYKEKYTSFRVFYNKHRPWDLFSPEEKSANKTINSDS